MNWDYQAEDDYYIDTKGVRFNFIAYRKRTDKEGFVRDFKEYQAETVDENKQGIPEELTPKGNKRKITVNTSWEYFKAKQRELRPTSETGKVYARRKIDVETVFGCMKASLGFTRYHVRGLEKVRKESGIVIMALNIMNLAVKEQSHQNQKEKEKRINNHFTDCLIHFFIWGHNYLCPPPLLLIFTST